MTYTITLTKSHRKQADAFLRQHPELRKKYDQALRLLEINPWHPSLRLHKLSGDLSGFYAVSITFSYRMTLIFKIVEHQIIPVDIGSHDHVY